MDVKDQKEIRELVKGICRKALEGEMGLFEFGDVWPESTDGDPLYDEIYRDLEYGIEHTPGYFFRKGINYEDWIDSDMYLRIYLDLVLLGYEKNSEELLQCRNYVLQQEFCSKENIDNEVKEYFNLR